MKKTELKVKCTDFSTGYNNHIFKLINKYYDIEISNNPDILIYSVFGKDYLNYKCVRVFYTGENVEPNFDECDYAFSFSR